MLTIQGEGSVNDLRRSSLYTPDVGSDWLKNVQCLNDSHEKNAYRDKRFCPGLTIKKLPCIPHP